MVGIHSAEQWELKDAYGYMDLAGERVYTTDYDTHEVLDEQSGPITDDHGSGYKLVIAHRDSGRPVIRQIFRSYADVAYLLVELEAEAQGEGEVSSNCMAPLAIDQYRTGALTIVGAADLKMMYVPYDNDRWTRYGLYQIHAARESYEVTALYESSNRRGIVVGSVTHDVWKTGISITGTLDVIDSFAVYGGAASIETRDSLPHGSVPGKKISSPRIFIGFFEDYRDGMEIFGKANTNEAPAMQWDGEVPFGWNSFAAIGGDLTTEVYLNASDFVKKLTDEHEFHANGVTYLNLDALWHLWPEEELLANVRHVHANGQKAGIYWAPFAFWEFFEKRDAVVAGTDGKYTIEDILLRDEEGNTLPLLDRALPIDPTHPGTLQRIKYYTDKFKAWGFEYLKLDFLSHAAMEGKHYRSDITTGTAAYNLAMNYLRDCLEPKEGEKRIFINLSISPLFPYHFAHSRRISCDAFGLNKDNEYLLNSITNGWWMNHTIYPFNDPDHTVMYKSFHKDIAISTMNEARTRLNSSVIGGSVLLLSDDFRIQGAREQVESLISNREITRLANRKLTFRPAEDVLGDRSAHVFIAHSPEEKAYYVGLFNTSLTDLVRKKVTFSQLQLDGSKISGIDNLWSSSVMSWNQDQMLCELEPMDSTILRISMKE